MESIIIITAIIIIGIIAVSSYIKKMKSGSCCSGEIKCCGKKVKVKDKNKNHYPYKKVLKIGGMTCTNCARTIENNFNELGNVYTRVNFDKEEAEILMKENIDDKILEDIIKKSGYRYYIKE